MEEIRKVFPSRPALEINKWVYPTQQIPVALAGEIKKAQLQGLHFTVGGC
jgi:hypothetical protein